MARKSDLSCSFCQKSQHEVRKLIAGPAAYICDECVGESMRQILDLLPEVDLPRFLRDRWASPDDLLLSEVVRESLKVMFPKVKRIIAPLTDAEKLALFEKSQAFRTPVCDLTRVALPHVSKMRLFPANMCKALGMIPIIGPTSCLVIACADPNDARIDGFVSGAFILRSIPPFFVACRRQIEEAIEVWYHTPKIDLVEEEPPAAQTEPSATPAAPTA